MLYCYEMITYLIHNMVNIVACICIFLRMLTALLIDVSSIEKTYIQHICIVLTYGMDIVVVMVLRLSVLRRRDVLALLLILKRFTL